MEDQGFDQLLEELNKELEKVDSIDERGMELLKHLNAEIQDLLERSGSATPAPEPSTFQRINDTIDYFEITHPTLAATLNKLLAILGNAGI
jgi:hypothetical protein